MPVGQAGPLTRPRTPTAHARNNIHAAAGLLAWLRSGGITLASCGQADIDEWLHTGPSAPLARDFLAWAASRGHCQRLAIPAPARATGAAVSQDQRWALATRLLNDNTLDPTDRVAGCLLLLYGQPLSRIAVMTTSQVTRHDSEVLIRLGRHDVPVPGPLATATLQLIHGGRHHLAVPRPPARAAHHPGQARRAPARPRHLRPGRRRAALLDLAAAVIASLLGLHETTAAKWMHQAGGDWSRYAGELARDQSSPAMTNTSAR